MPAVKSSPRVVRQEPFTAKSSVNMKQTLLLLFAICSMEVLSQSTPGRDSRSLLSSVNFSQLGVSSLEKSNNFDQQTKNPVHPEKAAELYLSPQKLNFDHRTPFISFSAAWDEPGDLEGNTQLYISISPDSLQWSSWQLLNPDPHSAETQLSFSSELHFFDKSTRYYRLKVVSNLLKKGIFAEKMLLNFFSPGETLPGTKTSVSPSQVSTPESACPCPLPQFVSRQGWNCPQGVTFPSFTKVTHLVVHHSASANTSNDWAAVVLSFWNFHVNTNGWADIGYNLLIDPNGTLYEGRGGGENVTGAHFCGKNGGTMGVCMIGTYTNTQASEAARKTLVDVLAWKACRENINPAETLVHASSGLNLFRISGHRDGCSTECPGEQLYRALPDIRTAVQTRIDACGLSTGTAPVPGLEYLRLTPNPLTSGAEITAEIMLHRSAMLRYVLFDAAGRQIAHSTPVQVQGQQQIRIPEFSNQPPGIYSIQFWVDDQTTSQRIAISR